MSGTTTANEWAVTREGIVHAKANATDPVYQDFAVREWSGGFLEYYHAGLAGWLTLPAAWERLVEWDK